VKQMRKRVWTVELRPQPVPDGVDRLGLAVKLMVEHAHLRFESEKRGRDAEEPACPDVHGVEWGSDR